MNLDMHSKCLMKYSRCSSILFRNSCYKNCTIGYHFSVCKAHVSLKWGYLKIYASASHNNCDTDRFKQQKRREAFKHFNSRQDEPVD